MAELIHEHSTHVKGEGGRTYIVRIYGQERTDGTWEGWLEFHPDDESKQVFGTEQETSQPNRTAIRVLGVGPRADISGRGLRPSTRAVTVIGSAAHKLSASSQGDVLTHFVAEWRCLRARRATDRPFKYSFGRLIDTQSRNGVIYR